MLGPWKKSYNKLCILKSRDITLPTKVCIVKVMIFPVITHGCESWTIKKAEHWRIESFELWCWRRRLTVLESKEIKAVYPKGNQPWIFIGRSETEAQAPILWPPDAKSQPNGKNWCWERWRAGGKEGNRGWNHWRALLINGHEFEQALRDSEEQGSLAWDCRIRHDLVAEQNNNTLFKKQILAPCIQMDNDWILPFDLYLTFIQTYFQIPLNWLLERH